jgi:ribosome-binding protein aMBF1 (putative translation factor)
MRAYRAQIVTQTRLTQKRLPGRLLTVSSAASRPLKRRESARETLAANLVLLRREKGWSQEDLALEAGLHRTFVAHVERRARNIALDNIEKLATALQVETFTLLQPHRSRG